MSVLEIKRADGRTDGRMGGQELILRTNTQNGTVCIALQKQCSDFQITTNLRNYPRPSYHCLNCHYDNDKPDAAKKGGHMRGHVHASSQGKKKGKKKVTSPVGMTVQLQLDKIKS
jgi:hypothetical protein